MAFLRVYSDKNTQHSESFNQLADIQKQLQTINIKIEVWQPKQKLSLEASPEEILEAFADDVKNIMANHGFKSVDVINMHSAMEPATIEKFRNKFLDEHIHSDDEVRYFIEGQGLFCVHAANKVYMILCEQGDFISVPAGTKHWFDMGAKPDFKCIRFFGDEVGWVAQYTQDAIARSYPLIEEYNVYK